jgi:RNA polymerase sigma factor (sigma-70 family)
MSKNGKATLTRFVREIVDTQATDRDLLARFLDQRDERAFEKLVRRHDRLVRSAIGKVMGNAPEAEDAYQAAFLVLVRRARAIDWRAGLGPWLYGVAHRVAVKAKARTAKRARMESQARPGKSILPPDLSWQEACDLLHSELDSLPDKYRLPLIYCYLEGKTREEAAVALGVTSGTVKGRIKRGCDILRDRLARRGVALSVGLLAVLAAPSVITASATSPLAVIAAVRGAAKPFVTSLAQEVVMGSVFSKLSKVLPIGILAIGVMSVALVAGVLAAGDDARTKLPEMPLTDQADDRLPEEAQIADAKKPAGEAEEGKPLTCNGKITDKATGKPVAGATVSVRWESISRSGVVGQRQVSKYQTDAEGKYSFVVPPEKMNLYVELQVGHPDFVIRAYYSGYAKALAQGKLDTQLDPGEAISGTVLTPDGKPAVGIRVVGVSTKPAPKGDVPPKFGGTPSHFAQGFAYTRTDAQGRFRLKLTTPGRARFWIMPDQYAMSQHRLNEKERGDLGKFTLTPGVSLTGKVLDVKGKPLAGVNVNASHLEKPENFLLGLYRVPEGRSALTNAKGEFTMEALAPGDYAVIPGTATLWDGALRSLGPFVEEGEVGKIYPMPDFFVKKSITLKEGVKPMDLEIRAEPSVVITLRFLDRNGKQYDPRDFFHLNGEFDKTRVFGMFQPDGVGKATFRAPHGLENTKVVLGTFVTTFYEYRLKKGDPLKKVQAGIDLGTVIEDLNIEIVDPIYPLPAKGAPKKDPKKD